jgi:archaemetzincin
MGTGAEAAARAEALELQPVGGLSPSALDELAERLSRHVELPCRPLPPVPDLPVARLAGRGQLDANALLAALEARATSPGRLLVGVTAEDIAVPVFTFVFGLARQGGRAAVVSLARTDPAFYGLPEDEELRWGRAVAEVLHELGHLAALEHCADGSCLMSFAGNVERVDARGGRFCPACAARLPAWLRGWRPPSPVA